jgi:23S rRNA (pseudouridine1915-N3)-methyltransferase
MRIMVIAVGRLRPPFQDDVEHYRKLLAGLAREDERVPRRIPERAHLVLLASDGRELDSLELSRWLEDRRQEGRDLCFVVGGPRGLDLEQCDTRLSLGRITLPHQLARVVLLEQLYRAHKILAGEPYHY